MDLTDHERFEVHVEDADRREEVALTAQLIVAANESVTALTQVEIDQILGISP